VQIGGPTGAFIVIVYAIVLEYGVANLIVCTLMAGIMLLAMGLAGLGSWIRFIPVSVVRGFTKGIAVLILLSQVKEFLGLSIGELPADFGSRLVALWQGLPSTNPHSVALGTGCVLLIVLWPKRWRALPSPVVALVAGTLVAWMLALDVETIGSRFGGIPTGLPAFAWPEFSWSGLGPLLPPAFTIALLGAIESLLSATVADAMIDDRHDPNQELIAQGLANIAAPLFGGFCATGAIARTSTNVRMGGRTPVAGIVHALTLLAILLVAAPVARHVPLTVLSAILVVVAWNMADWGELRELRRYRFNYQAVLLATFALTVVFDLTVAVQVGLILAGVFFITRVSGLTVVRAMPSGQAPRVVTYEVFGSLFFGAANKLEPLLSLAEPGHPCRVVVLDMGKLINIDTTGLETLCALQRKLVRSGRHLLIASANEQPLSLFERSGFIDTLGRENLCASMPAALARASALD
jgi:SulP family sulfate permease